MEKPGSLGEIARAFLRLGFIAFGGAAAHLGLMEQEFVNRRGWLSREDFLDRLGAVNLLPGPTSTEMAIYLGELRGGLAGLLVAGAAFILPAAAMTMGLAWLYVRYGALPQLAGLLWGIKPVVVVLLAQAVASLARAALKSRELVVLAGVVLGLAAMRVPTLPLLIGTGVAWVAAERFGQARAAAPVQASAAAAGGAAALTVPAAAGVFVYFLKVGALLFGSGYVLLAVLREDLVVRLHWLNQTQLLDAIAVSQATPGPFFTVATFVGYLLGGWRGAALATAGMFLPAFTYVALTAKVLPRMRKSPLAATFLDGVNTAAVSLMALVGLQFTREVVASLPALAVLAAAGVLVFRYRVNSAWVILGGALCGVAIKMAMRSGLGP